MNTKSLSRPAFQDRAAFPGNRCHPRQRKLGARIGFIHALLLPTLLALSSSAQLNDAQHPLRIINGSTVNLTPRILWSGPPANHPLTAWKTIAGAKTSECSLGWVVMASVEGSKPLPIVLKNPPAFEWQEFQNLRLQYLALLQRCRQLDNSTADINSRQAQDLRGQVDVSDRTLRGKEDRQRAVQDHRAISRDFREGEALKHANDHELASLRNQIRNLRAFGYNLDQEFPVSCLALATGQKYHDLPVYDHGIVMP